ncbi:hypothetical protein ACROYT_G026609 [Oculina patagonica]
MKAISVVSLVFLTACAVTGNPLGPLKESRDLDGNLAQQKREVPENFEPVGCYSFAALKKVKIFGKDAYKKTKATSATPFDQCTPEAKENDYEIIGIQKIKKNIVCRKGNEEQWKPDADIKKLDPDDCKNDVGSKKSIFIYRKSQIPENNKQCTFKDKLYKDGDEAKMYHKTDNELNAFCRVCHCSRGEFRDCFNHTCEVGFLRQHCPEIIHPPNKCCPICKPSKCNGRKTGQTWLEHKGKNCLHCECHSGDQDEASCKMVKTFCPPVSCKDPVIPKGQCCPYCESEPTTQPEDAVFTIKLTEETPTPDFQFPF